jgi:S-adenosylmethionine decarboxylase
MQVKELHGKGNHLIIDAKKCNKSINKKEFIEEILNELPEKVGMKKISTPLVINYESEKISESGITGFVIIAKSHISIHTYPTKKFANIDVFSCKEFEFEKIINYFKNKLETNELNYKLVKRGFN